MKRTIAVLSLLVLCVVAAKTVSAQSDPRIGTWKLNLAKSQDKTRTNETRTYTQAGDAVKSRIEYVNSNGSRHSYGVIGKPDSKTYPFTGEGPGGAETVSIKRVGNAFIFDAKKGGKLLFRTKMTFSEDGKVMTMTTKGHDANGRPLNTVRVYDKQ
jgi:hypothetical protein